MLGNILFNVGLPLAMLALSVYIILKALSLCGRGKLSIGATILWYIVSILPVGVAVIVLMTRDGLVGFVAGAILGAVELIAVVILSIGTYRIIEAIRHPRHP